MHLFDSEPTISKTAALPEAACRICIYTCRASLFDRALAVLKAVVRGKNLLDAYRIPDSHDFIALDRHDNILAVLQCVNPQFSWNENIARRNAIESLSRDALHGGNYEKI